MALSMMQSQHHLTRRQAYTAQRDTTALQLCTSTGAMARWTKSMATSASLHTNTVRLAHSGSG